MNKSTEIQRNDVVKYLKCLYLVKDLEKLENGNFRLNYYFRITRKDNAKLHFNESYDISSYLLKQVKRPSTEEAEFLISRIKVEHPNFDLSFIKQNKNKIKSNLNENDCIEYLKSKGYLVYKQI